MNNRHPLQLKKNQNPGSRFGATRYTPLPIWPIWPKFEVNGLDWQCCLASSSQGAPRILIFSIAMDADYSFYVKTIETYVRTFLALNISAIGRVKYLVFQDPPSKKFHNLTDANTNTIINLCLISLPLNLVFPHKQLHKLLMVEAAFHFPDPHFHRVVHILLLDYLMT